MNSDGIPRWWSGYASASQRRRGQSACNAGAACTRSALGSDPERTFWHLRLELMTRATGLKELCEMRSHDSSPQTLLAECLNNGLSRVHVGSCSRCRQLSAVRGIGSRCLRLGHYGALSGASSSLSDQPLVACSSSGGLLHFTAPWSIATLIHCKRFFDALRRAQETMMMKDTGNELEMRGIPTPVTLRRSSARSPETWHLACQICMSKGPRTGSSKC